MALNERAPKSRFRSKNLKKCCADKSAVPFLWDYNAAFALCEKIAGCRRQEKNSLGTR